MGRRFQSSWATRRGFTLLEVLIATALLSFSLIVMFGFHAQALRSNLHARKITDCTYLAQNKMEQLTSLEWTPVMRPASLVDTMDDQTSASQPWAWLEYPNGGGQPAGVNASGQTSATDGQPIYFVTWDVQDMDAAATWMRIRVRCVYEDQRFNTWTGTTISSYKYRDQ
jgi:prepilin-type N-terminal cleavage/methylation domain-containing protein